MGHRKVLCERDRGQRASRSPGPYFPEPGLRQAPYQKAEHRVGLLAELRKRRDALDQAIRALEISEQ